MINHTKFGVLLWPSIRAVAYLSTMRELGIYPDEIIWLDSSISKLEEVCLESKKFGYITFFDVECDLNEFTVNCNSIVYHANTSDINSSNVMNLLEKCESEYFIFTGGGILSRTMIENTGKRFIHVHPGLIQEYRGSTCFYYSILNDFSIGTTAFFMESSLDTGAVIQQTHFNLNYKISSKQPLFMDYILDPYIRAMTLKPILIDIASGKEIKSKKVLSNERQYYVMHPFLRHLAIKKINYLYDKNKPSGIFELNY